LFSEYEFLIPGIAAISYQNLRNLDTIFRVSVKPRTPRNTPEHPGTPWNTPGTSPEHPRNTLETVRNTPGTPKIVVSDQTAHELTKPKTSEDSQFFIRLLRITLRFPSFSRMLGIFSKLLRTAKKPLINGKNISCAFKNTARW